jgi:very-short-patch-repair endonuclease
LAELATDQGGVVSRAQALALGLSPRAIGRRLAAGRLHVVHPSVYAVGHGAMTPRGWLMAAVLAGGDGAVASHRSAAWWHGLVEKPPARHDVTIRGSRRSPRIRFHRNRLSDDLRTACDGVPVTTAARALLDLADTATERTIERALDRAEVRRLLHLPDLLELVAAANGRRGVGRLRRVLATHAAGSTLTRSELEERMLAQTRTAGLPMPRVNTIVAGFEVDLYWPGHRLAVEIDGGFHDAPVAFVDDRRRDAALQIAGIRVVRFAEVDVLNGRAIAVLSALLREGVLDRGRYAS